MPFFDPPESMPPPRLPLGPVPARWAGPPSGVLGELVVDRLEVVRTTDVHVAVEDVRAYPVGFELQLVVRSRSGPVPEGLTVFAWRNAGTTPLERFGAGLPRPPRFGLGFPDGTALTNLSPALGVPDDAPGPLLVQTAPAGSPLVIGPPTSRWWVWGLPPAGAVTVAVEVPEFGVPETIVRLDGDAIRAAAARTEVLWEVEPTARPFPAPGPPSVFVPEPRPIGPPPDDEPAARAGIERAFAGVLEADGDVVVNVEGGAGLGPTLRELHTRFGGAEAGAAHQVERVTFLDAASAAVVFSVWVGSSPYLQGVRGDAVLRDGRWLVARSTFCGLMARAGIACPP